MPLQPVELPCMICSCLDMGWGIPSTSEPITSRLPKDSASAHTLSPVPAVSAYTPARPSLSPTPWPSAVSTSPPTFLLTTHSRTLICPHCPQLPPTFSSTLSHVSSGQHPPTLLSSASAPGALLGSRGNLRSGSPADSPSCLKPSLLWAFLKTPMGFSCCSLAAPCVILLLPLDPR